MGHQNNGHEGYLKSDAEYSLVSPKTHDKAEDVREFYEISATSITEIEQRNEHSKWTAKNDTRTTFDNIETVVKIIFEDVVDTTYHLGGTGITTSGFCLMTPTEILAHLRWLYGKPGYQDIKPNLAPLAEPMDHNLPIKVMVQHIKVVQMFILKIPG